MIDDKERRPERQFEWTMALALIVMGAIVLWWPESIESTAYNAILRVSGPITLGATYAVAGAARLFALLMNGRLGIYAQVIRISCAAMSAMILGQMVAAFVVILPERSWAPSPSMGFYFVFMVSECYSVHRTLARG